MKTAKIDRIHIRVRDILRVCNGLAAAAKNMKGRTMSDKSFRDGVCMTTNAISKWARKASRQKV